MTPEFGALPNFVQNVNGAFLLWNLDPDFPIWHTCNFLRRNNYSQIKKEKSGLKIQKNYTPSVPKR